MSSLISTEVLTCAILESNKMIKLMHHVPADERTGEYYEDMNDIIDIRNRAFALIRERDHETN